MARKKTTKKKTKAGAKRYARQLERSAQRGLADAQAARDIGPIPMPADIDRRIAGMKNLQLFNETYFPNRFDLEWSVDHIEIQKMMQDVAIKNLCYALAMARASGKSTLCETLCLFSVLHSYHRFLALIAAAKTMAEYMLDSIKRELDGNELLIADFPEVCLPLSQLNNRGHRCKGQHSEGELTYTSWERDRVTFPTVFPKGWTGKAKRFLGKDGGALTNGATIVCLGIESGIRGMKHTLRSGVSIRPTLAVVDDPQTQESANSNSQTASRMRILKRDIRQLAGPGKQTATVVPCTVIQQGDLSDQLLDLDANPHFHGKKFRMVWKFPDRMDLWEGPYDELRRDGLRSNQGFALCTDFYRRQRRAMRQGAKIAWEARFDDDAGELDGLQHAMNLYLEDRDGFFAECQNEPRDNSMRSADIVTATHIMACLNDSERDQVPDGRDKLIAHIDVQGDLLYWAMVSFSLDYSADVVAYGSWPDQGKRYYTNSTASQLLSKMYSGTPDARIRAGLSDLIKHLDCEWFDEVGTAQRLTAIGVDSRYKKKAVFLACRENALCIPMQGIYIGARTEPLAAQKRQQGDRVGPTWRSRIDAQYKRAKVQVDINEVKSQVHAAFAAADDVPGRLRLYGKPGGGRRKLSDSYHAMLADHCTAENGTKTKGRGRECIEWELPPSKPDNHHLDNLVGCYALASRAGCALPGETPTPTKRRKRRVRTAQPLFGDNRF